MIGLVAATANGRCQAKHLAQVFEDARLYEGKPKEALAAAWNEDDALVLFLAAGAAVRLLAPLLKDKRRDPGVVCVDDAGRFAVALVGGHAGGANELAERVADALGAVASVQASTSLGELEGPSILITDQLLPDASRPSVVYRPPSLVVGVGCSRGASAAEILGLLESALREAGLSQKSVASLSSIDVKSDEAGLLEAAQALSVPLSFYTAEKLAAVEVSNPSPVVAGAVGTPSVAEAAVLAAGAQLLLEKRKSRNATVAIGRLLVRGRLALVSLGPGNDVLIPPLARDALAEAELVVGLEQYIARVRHLLRPGTRVLTLPLGDEVTRAEEALAEARAGGSTAIVSSGDVGVYAMAAPALELAGDDVDVVVVPGITAAQAAASLLGSPLGHDHCSISLSDLLTPWEVIENRVRAAALGDFVISLYNPRSRGRDWQLGKVQKILLEHRPPDTPVGIVKDAYREDQRIILTDLASLHPEDVDMLTIVVVGSSQTRLVAGRMVTPRGYLG